MPSLRLAEAARDDLRDLRKHSKAAFGPQVARRYLDGLRMTFALLRERPSAGVLEADLGVRVRSFPYRSHRVYYQVGTDTVLVLRILHHARDAKHQFAGFQE